MESIIVKLMKKPSNLKTDIHQIDLTYIVKARHAREDLVFCQHLLIVWAFLSFLRTGKECGFETWNTRKQQAFPPFTYLRNASLLQKHPYSYGNNNPFCFFIHLHSSLQIFMIFPGYEMQSFSKALVSLYTRTEWNIFMCYGLNTISVACVLTT
jgi:hypothetical protein